MTQQIHEDVSNASVLEVVVNALQPSNVYFDIEDPESNIRRFYFRSDGPFRVSFMGTGGIMEYVQPQPTRDISIQKVTFTMNTFIKPLCIALLDAEIDDRNGKRFRMRLNLNDYADKEAYREVGGQKIGNNTLRIYVYDYDHPQQEGVMTKYTVPNYPLHTQVINEEGKVAKDKDGAPHLKNAESLLLFIGNIIEAGYRRAASLDKSSVRG